MQFSLNFVQDIANTISAGVPHLFDGGIAGFLPAVQNMINSIIAILIGM